MAGWLLSVSSGTIDPQPLAELDGCFEESDDSNLYILGAHAYWFEAWIAIYQGETITAGGRVE